MFRIGESPPLEMDGGEGGEVGEQKRRFYASFCHLNGQKEFFTKRDMLYKYARTGVRRVSGLHIYSFLTREYTFLN